MFGWSLDSNAETDVATSTEVGIRPSCLKSVAHADSVNGCRYV